MAGIIEAPENKPPTSGKVRSEVNPMATTMVGNTKGTVITARRNFCPLKRRLYSKYAPGMPRIRVITAERNACQIVNHTIAAIRCVVMAAIVPPSNPIDKIRPSGK